MSLIRIIAACLAALLIAGPAWADVTARYAQEGGGPPILVQAGDNGDSRVTVDEAIYVTTGGIVYMILDDAAGRFVVRQQDFLNLLDELMRATAVAEAAYVPAPVISEGGSEILAGRSGTVFRISDPRQASDTFELVISTDPELAQIGRAIGSLVAAFSTTMGRSWPGFASAFSELVGRGALLRLGHWWRLESVDVGPVPQSAFALPSAPLDRDALRARLNAGAGPASR